MIEKTVLEREAWESVLVAGLICSNDVVGDNVESKFFSDRSSEVESSLLVLVVSMKIFTAGVLS